MLFPNTYGQSYYDEQPWSDLDPTRRSQNLA